MQAPFHRDPTSLQTERGSQSVSQWTSASTVRKAQSAACQKQIRNQLSDSDADQQQKARTCEDASLFSWT